MLHAHAHTHIEAFGNILLHIFEWYAFNTNYNPYLTASPSKKIIQNLKNKYCFIYLFLFLI